MDQKIYNDTEEKMKKSYQTIQRELSSLRTGKATSSLLDTVKVDYHGTIMPLNQLASISAPEARLLIVQAWDKSVVGEIAKGIQKADLGLNPMVEGNIIRLPIPPLNEERRKELVKHCRKIAEEGKVAVRNIRRDANEHLKKAEKDKQINEDDHKKEAEKVQKLTDHYINMVDSLMSAKEKEIMEV